MNEMKAMSEGIGGVQGQDPYFGCDSSNETASSMFPVQGVDVSQYQGVFDWGAAINEGRAEFGFARASIGYGDVDSQFNRNYASMCDYNILRGAYHFAYPKSVSSSIEQDAKDEANYFAETFLKAEETYGKGMDCGMVMPPFVDYEQKTPWSQEENRLWITTFIETAQSAFKRGLIIYTGDNVWSTQMGGDPWLTGMPLWVPHYSNGTVPGMTPWTRWAMWQWSGGGSGDIYRNLVGEPFPGSESGGSVDVNAWWGTLEQLRQICDPKYDRWLADSSGKIGPNPWATAQPPGGDLVIKAQANNTETGDILRRIRDGGDLTFTARLADGGKYTGRCQELHLHVPGQRLDMAYRIEGGEMRSRAVKKP